MLSVTVLPAELHFISGVPGLMLFKVVYPAISALFPVAVYGLARLILPRRWAFAAAAVIVMQAAVEKIADRRSQMLMQADAGQRIEGDQAEIATLGLVGAHHLLVETGTRHRAGDDQRQFAAVQTG